MNDLNSIILEGNSSKALPGYGFVDNEEKTLIYFTLVTKRSVMNENGEKVEKKYNIPCRAVGNTAKNVNKFLPKNELQGLRVVGLLKQDAEGLYVLAEHIEYKNQKKKTNYFEFPSSH